MDRIFLKKNEENRIRLGHPWIFDNEIERYDGPCENGTPVQVVTKAGHFLGTGIINRDSKITVRIFTRDKNEEIDQSFFIKMISRSYEIRSTLYGEKDSYRLIFAEADFIPGLVVDRFVRIDGKVFLSVQFLTRAVDTYRDQIISALQSVLSPFAIFERSDVHVRALEGLEEKKGWIGKPAESSIVILENGIELEVDLENGQKTGYFLDQKDNRQFVSTFCKGKRVLDTFTHTGSFGLHAWKGGAVSVISSDISAQAIETVTRNIERNKAGSVVSALEADTFDLLKSYEKENTKFDLIILDPPAFTKSAKMIEKAYGGYKEINLRAMKILESGGILVTCSCSHFFTAEHFFRMIQNAAMDAHKSVQILSKRGAGADHPVLVGYPESEYLTCVVLRVW